ncbi:MAG: hypothetical protein ACJAV7_002449, partial [Flavobacteriales bacterium]
SFRLGDWDARMIFLCLIFSNNMHGNYATKVSNTGSQPTVEKSMPYFL